jgi:parallel beta-helix repeat protein
MYERNNVEIRNGTIRDFNRCIYEAGVGKNHRLINLRVISNMDLGIYLNSTHNLVKDCVVSDNANLAIHTGNSSTITGNIVADNGKSATGIAVFGIRTGKGCFVTNNTVSNNGTSATLTGNVLGITTGDGCTVIGNTVYDNGRDADADVYGIVTGNGCAIIANTSYYNGYSATGDVYGISFSGYDLVDQNTAYSNGLTASGTATNMTQGVTGCAYGKNVAP